MFNGLDYISVENEANYSCPGAKSLNGVSPNELYQLITDRIIEVIEKGGDLVWQKPWYTKNKTGLAASNFVTKKAYKGINAFMLNLVYPLLLGRKFNSPYFLTFKQVKELGGQVKKGSEGIEVFYYTVIYTENGKNIKEAEYAALREKVVTKTASPSEKSRYDKIMNYAMMRYYNVFSADDIIGIDFSLPTDVEPPKNDFERIEICESIVANYPNPQPKIVQNDPTGAYYIMGDDIINIPEINLFKTPQEYYSTLFHELTHSTGVEKRLGRNMSREHYAFEELVAELGASYLNAESGILYHNLKNSAAYLKGWKKEVLKKFKEDNKFFAHAAAAAQKSSDFILQADENGVPLYRQEMYSLTGATGEKRIFVQQRSAPYQKDGSTTFKLRDKSGVYIIFLKDKIDYVGYSGTDIYKTLYRHFQKWNDKTQVRVTYNNLKDITVRVIYTKSAAIAQRLENALIVKYRPEANPNKYETKELTAQDENNLTEYIEQDTNPIITSDEDLPF